MQSKPFRLAVVAGIAMAAVAAAIAVSASGGDTPPAPPPESLAVAGLPERAGVLGDPGAPVTVTEYVDLQCPVCAVAARELLPTLIEEHVRPGRVKLEMRTLHFLGPDSERAARFAAGAERQGRLWAFAEAFYARQGAENSGYVSDEFLRETAVAAGVEADAALSHADGGFATSRLERANADAARHGIDATPTFTVTTRDGTEVVDAASLLGVLERVSR